MSFISEFLKGKHKLAIYSNTLEVVHKYFLKEWVTKKQIPVKWWQSKWTFKVFVLGSNMNTNKKRCLNCLWRQSLILEVVGINKIHGKLPLKIISNTLDSRILPELAELLPEWPRRGCNAYPNLLPSFWSFTHFACLLHLIHSCSICVHSFAILAIVCT